jgi:hypothetical protein
MDNVALFISSLAEAAPPQNYSNHLKALWWAKKNNWDKAHDIVQDGKDPGSSWIHAWLHRVEGDEGNASYWYSRAGKEKPEMSLDDEWLLLVSHLMSLQA